MPCQDTQGDAEDDFNRANYPIASALACSYCKSLEAAGKPIPDFAKEWWENHKRHDAEVQRHNIERKM